MNAVKFHNESKLCSLEGWTSFMLRTISKMPLRLNAFGVHILLIGLGATPRDRLRGEAPLRLSRGKRKCRP